MSTPHPLAGARIRRVDAPAPHLLAFTLSSPELRTVLVACLRPGALGMGLVDKRPLGLPASAFVRKLRKELEGGALTGLTRERPRRVALTVRRGELVHRVRLEFDGKPNALLLDGDGTVSASMLPVVGHEPEHTAADGSNIAWGDTIEQLQAHGARLLATAEAGQLRALREALVRGVRTADKRLQRRSEAITGEVERATLVPKLRADATLLLGNLSQVPRGASSARVLDYTQDPPAQVELVLDPAQTLRSQADAWFHKARRFERGARVASERLALTEQQREQLAQLRQAIETAGDRAALDALLPHARALGVRLQQVQAESSGKRVRQAPTPPYRELRGARERSILVGRGAEQNDALTLRHARPHDLWLHARDTSGAHVVVPLERGQACPPDLLRDAALLAAHFSGHRGEPVVDVIYTERRYVRKPKGASAGSVSLEREKVFRLQLDSARLQQLLASALPDA